MTNLTNEQKIWIKAKAKEEGINTVGKSYEYLTHALADKMGETSEVIEFLAGGGNIAQVEGFTKVAPKKVRRTKTKETKKAIVEKKHIDYPKGVVSVYDLCEELGIEPRIARRRLRASGLKKQGNTWNWKKGSDDYKAVKKLLSK